MITRRHMEDWHGALSRVTGAISLTLTRKTLKMSDALEWQSVVERIASEMLDATVEQRDLFQQREKPHGTGRQSRRRRKD